MNSNVEMIRSMRTILMSARRVFVLTGAGISAESGVSTFRGGGGSPVWRGMPFEELSSARMVNENLPLVWEWFDYRLGVVSECDPNAGHVAIADAELSGRFDQFTLVTQNIDGLHELAGSESVIELHGNIHRARCLSRGHLASLSELPNEERPHVCPECGDLMRPDVVLFGECLSETDLDSARAAAESCDVCLVVGTSALVYPANSLPGAARRNGAVIIEVNPDVTALTADSDIPIRGSAAEILPAIFEAIAVTKGKVYGDDVLIVNKATASATRTSLTYPLRVEFLKSEEFPVLRNLGMTFAPGKKQPDAITGAWDRDLEVDLKRLVEDFRTDTLVSVMEPHEFDALKISALGSSCPKYGIEWLTFSVVDGSVPESPEGFEGFVTEIVRRLEEGKRVVIHCKGGLGRTGLTAACVIIAASDGDVSPDQAMRMVRRARAGTIENPRQEAFVASFATGCSEST
jgi:NAD-dependent deacetylase